MLLIDHFSPTYIFFIWCIYPLIHWYIHSSIYLSCICPFKNSPKFTNCEYTSKDNHSIIILEEILLWPPGTQYIAIYQILGGHGKMNLSVWLVVRSSLQCNNFTFSFIIQNCMLVFKNKMHSIWKKDLFKKVPKNSQSAGFFLHEVRSHCGPWVFVVVCYCSFLI